jgi:phosphonate transport system ATP-binding protein
LTVAIEVIGSGKSFQAGRPVLADIGFTIASGEMVALIGASGSGKSTLIRAIAGLIEVDRPARCDDGRRGGGRRAGSIRILGQPMQEEGRILSAASRLRARVGVVFQQFNLVPRLSVLTNVCLGLLGQIPSWRGSLGRFTKAEQRRAMKALDRVGIAGHALKRGSQLSGGQQQRAAIARTLVQGAEVLIADEPIASLDPSAARRVMDILAELNRQDRITVLVSLHQVEYALAYCPRAIALREGRIVYDGPTGALTPAFLGELYGAESEELILPGAGAAAPAVPAANGHPVALGEVVAAGAP